MSKEADPIMLATNEDAKKKSSPYDLNSHDNPGNVIAQVQLKGENYDEWS